MNAPAVSSGTRRSATVFAPSRSVTRALPLLAFNIPRERVRANPTTRTVSPA